MKTMKKYLFMAVAAMAALSSCSSDNDFEQNQTGKQNFVFTATMENSEATRATFDSENKCAAWEAGDQISINGKTYSAQAAGTTTTFKVDGEDAPGTTYNAYFPADLYDGTTAKLPTTQTYKEGKFNMPMYASSTTTELEFKNLCAVLAVKVTSADIETLKSIKVASDKKMSGMFTIGENNEAIINVYAKGTYAVVLESPTALTLTSEGTVFYIAIPAQKYEYLNIFLSADGKTYTQAMATKKADGLGEIARSKIFSIDYAKNATKLWAGYLFIADCNVGAASAIGYGNYYSWGGFENVEGNSNPSYNTGSGNLSYNSTATKLWGNNWRMPTKEEFSKTEGGLLYECDCTWTTSYNQTGVSGLLCKGKGTYSSNSVFLPAAGDCFSGEVIAQSLLGDYWTSTPNGSDSAYRLQFGVGGESVLSYYRNSGYSVRAVLREEESPAPATTGSAKRTGNIDVKWVQLWKDGPKFAEYNVGAANNKPEGDGWYYSWGESNDHDPSGSYKEGTDALTGTDDTATKLWGSNWRMPTKAELEALHSNCDVKFIQDPNDDERFLGIKFIGRGNYESNSMFLPAAGYRYDGDAYGYRDGGFYWSSTPNVAPDGSREAYSLYFNGGYLFVKFSNRSDSYSIRPVLAE